MKKVAQRKSDASVELRLLETAIDCFGREGLDGASTRRIAASAGTIMSSITYHFGGKEGLYLAAARHIAAQLSGRMHQAIEVAQPSLAPGATRDEAIAALLSILDRFTEIMTHPESEPWARFIVREQMDPTEAFDAIFATIGQFAGTAARLIERISEGRCDPADARLRVIAIVGQVLAYRTAKAALLKLTGWEDVDSDGVARIRQVVREHTLAIINGNFGKVGS